MELKFKKVMKISDKWELEEGRGLCEEIQKDKEKVSKVKRELVWRK